MSEPPAEAFERFDCTSTDQGLLDAAAEAARVAIERGECIVLPTDTVYGIGADAFSSDAVQRLLDVKQRGRDMPPPVLIGDASLMRALAVSVPQSAKDLVAKHWPGPLTVICKAQPSLRMDLGDTEGTIALRVPDHAVTLDVLSRTGPMAVSSANISGAKPAQSCDEAVAQLGDRIAVYLDGGTLRGDATGSTIVDFTQRDSGEVLRHGALSVELLRETCPDLSDLVEPAEVSGDSDDEAEQDEELVDQEDGREPGEGHESPDRFAGGDARDPSPDEPSEHHVWAQEGGATALESSEGPRYLGPDDGDTEAEPDSPQRPAPPPTES